MAETWWRLQKSTHVTVAGAVFADSSTDLEDVIHTQDRRLQNPVCNTQVYTDAKGSSLKSPILTF